MEIYRKSPNYCTNEQIMITLAAQPNEYTPALEARMKYFSMHDSLQLSDNVHEAQKIHCFVKKYTTLLIDKLTNIFCLPYEELVRHARSSNGLFPLFLCGL